MLPGHPLANKDEYEMSCTLEHAVIHLNWLIGIFGDWKTVHAFADCLITGEGLGDLSPADTPDYSVASLKFKNGVVARITCSIIAPHNHEIRVIGDKGVLLMNESWHCSSPVKYQRATLTAHKKAERYTFIRNSKILSYIFGFGF